MALIIPVAHDFTCPWCWVGLHQAKRLQEEEGVEIEFRGYELFPDELEFGVTPIKVVNPKRPPTMTRHQFLLEIEGMTMPAVEHPKKMRTHNALEAAEFAKEKGKGFEFIEALYRAFWEKGIEINNPDYLLTLGRAFGLDPDELQDVITSRRYKDRIVPFDDAAYAAGVFNVPTFFIGADRWAEQPYRVLRDAVRKIHPSEPVAPYKGITLPASSGKRPYVILDMVATIDGKTISGERNEPVLDLGSKADHEAMHNLEDAVDAVLIGAGTLAATPITWKTRAKIPLVMTRRGELNLNHGFLDSEEAIIIMPQDVELQGRTMETVMRSTDPNIDPTEILKKLKKHGVERLLILGGSEVNSVFLRDDLVDEIFLTVAPKVKLGAGVPTLAGGKPLRRDELLGFHLESCIQRGDELFLRYRRNRG